LLVTKIGSRTRTFAMNGPRGEHQEPSNFSSSSPSKSRRQTSTSSNNKMETGSPLFKKMMGEQLEAPVSPTAPTYLPVYYPSSQMAQPYPYLGWGYHHMPSLPPSALGYKSPMPPMNMTAGFPGYLPARQMPSIGILQPNLSFVTSYQYETPSSLKHSTELLNRIDLSLLKPDRKDSKPIPVISPRRTSGKEDTHEVKKQKFMSLETKREIMRNKQKKYRKEKNALLEKIAFDVDNLRAQIRSLLNDEATEIAQPRNPPVMPVMEDKGMNRDERMKATRKLRDQHKRNTLHWLGSEKERLEKELATLIQEKSSSPA